MVLAAAPPCVADVLVLTDGRRFDGTVVSEDGNAVVFAAVNGGAAMRLRFPLDQVARLERVAKDGPSYSRLPIVGVIGDDGASEQFVSAEAFRAALVELRGAHPDYVVLCIDSDGGRIDDMQAIVEAIAEAEDLRFIAYVEKALSAAAVIALVCPKIYVTPQATIGAAVPWQLGPDGTPKLNRGKAPVRHPGAVPHGRGAWWPRPTTSPRNDGSRRRAGCCDGRHWTARH